MSIIEISKQLEELVIKNDLTEISSVLKNEYAISKSDELKKAISQIEDEGRTLKIGIVGRVKAGKSSLLNALVFDGKDILPKAATPMTAALTILEYSDETKAEVDFFSQEDINDIKIDYENYIVQVENLTKQKFEELSKIKLKKIKELTPELTNEIEDKAKKRAHNEMKNNDKLFSSYDQYQKIKKSGVTINELNEYKTIVADDMTSLNNKLYDFVGANGKYMPFTKSVTLKLKEDSLKDIQIIDTPGVNDPVTSREDRTKELLKYCDVVLVVSPSGQFLSSEDIDLMDRITTKEGISEVYIVASQVDNQLFGSEKAKGNGTVSGVLNVISSNLSQLQKSVLTKQKEQFPEIGITFDKLIDSKVLLSSGISYSMLKNFDNKENWDKSTNKVWENLNEHYPDYFNTKDIALANLENLANINKIKNIIDDVRVKKDKILQKRKDEFIKIKQKSLLEYKDAIEENIKESIKRIQNSDIDAIRTQKEELLKVQTRVSKMINEEYFDLIESLELDIKSTLTDKVKSYFNKTKNDVRDSESTETESREVYVGRCGFLWLDKEYKTVASLHTVVKAGFIRNSLEDLTYEIEDTIDKDSKNYLINWKKSLYKSLVSALRSEVGDDALDITLIRQTIRAVLNTAKYPEISYNGDMPSELKKSGTLKNHEAESFLDAASNYISNLNNRVRDDIKSYIESLVNILKGQNIADNIFKRYTSDIEKLENDIKYKELSLDRLNNIIQQLGMIDD